MPRIVLYDHSHDAADKLNIRRERAKGPKDRCNTQMWVIETFAQHLHLNDAIKHAGSQLLEDFCLLLISHLAVENTSLVTSLGIEGSNRACVIDAHRNSD